MSTVLKLTSFTTVQWLMDSITLKRNYQSVFACFLIHLLNAELNAIRRFLALLGALHILHVSRIRVNIPIIL